MNRPWKIKFDFVLDNKDIPMYRQLAEHIQQMIETGVLLPGDLLPGSREMAEEMHVSRKTILSAMDLLVFSGWIENRERVGLFVRDRSSLNQLKHTHKDSTPATSEPTIDAPTSQLGYKLVINDGFPDTQLVPFELLSRTFRQLLNRAARWKMLGYEDPRGYIKLRSVLAHNVSQERGLATSVDELMLTRGSQQALYLIAHALLHTGDVVAMEDPGYESARKAFLTAQLEVRSVSVDNEGINVDALASMLEQGVPVKAIYVTPRYQYPTTVTLSPQRRRMLVDLVLKYNLIVIEDDFGFHFQFSGHHIKPLSVLLPKANYVYIGTFSKILAPALRMGFVVSSLPTLQLLADYRHLVDIQGDNVMERAILCLIEEGELTRHLRRACRTYKERLLFISNLIEKQLADRVVYHKPHGGLALWLILRTNPTSQLLRMGISVHVIDLPDKQYGLRIGYASMSKAEIELLIDALNRAGLAPCTPAPR